MNKLIKLFLVLTSLAPVMLTYWFVEQSNSYNKSKSFFENCITNYKVGYFYIITTLILVLFFWLIIYLSKNKLEKMPIIIEEIKSADNESISFILVYLLPLASKIENSINIPVLIFISVLFFIIVFTSNSYHFNPLLNFIGYHFYEVKVQGGVTYVLLTRDSINSSKNINSVSLISEYTILENK
jgi:hypothetical protein